MGWKKTCCVFMTCSFLSPTKNTLTGSPRPRARLEPNAFTKHLQQYSPMVGGIYSYFNGHHHRLQRRPEIPTGYLRPGIRTHTLSYPHRHMHTFAHVHTTNGSMGRTWILQDPRQKGSLLSQGLRIKDSGVLNQALTYVSPLPWANHFNIIPPGFTHQLYGHAV